MKKIFVIIIVILSVISCKKELKNHVRLSGQLDGLEAADTLFKLNSRSYSKAIKIDTNGKFSDTFHIKAPDFYSIVIGRKVRFAPYLTIGNDLKITGDLQDLNNTLVFEGSGEETNNYLITRKNEVQKFTENFKSLADLDSIEFNSKINDFKDLMEGYLSNEKIDTLVVSKEKEGLTGFLANIGKQYTKIRALKIKFAKGKESPKFSNLENYKGGTTSLDDFKGKYVYIDVWATWCRPCLKEIPAIKELETEYEDVVFVSISTDRPEKHEAWQTMIEEKEMSGVQLFAGVNQSFSRDYDITSIPRFIFIDPNGKIINADMPKPSDKEATSKIFTEAGL